MSSKLLIGGVFVPMSETAPRLAEYDVEWRRWFADRAMLDGTDQQGVIDRFQGEIEAEKARGGYAVADVVSLEPEMELQEFARPHYHTEDEVRMIVNGSGVFGFEIPGRPQVSLCVEAGDFIRIPSGLQHWFALGYISRILAIRLFKDVAGWIPHYEKSGSVSLYGET